MSTFFENTKLNLETTAAALREVLRACALPFWIGLHGFRRGHWRSQAKRALAADPAAVGARGLDSFAALAQRGATRAGSNRQGTSDDNSPAHIFISAGEASGEGHAARLIETCGAKLDVDQTPQPRWTAFGGGRLRAAGASVVYPLSEHAVMGVRGVLASLPFVIRAYRSFVQVLHDDRPALVVLVDYPGLHLVMARAAKRRNIPVLHYIAPQYWGWGPWRMSRYRRAVDATLTILPFEAPFYDEAGIPAAYVGHPLLDQLAADGEGEGRTEAETTDTAQAPLLCIMPGSRRREIEANLEPMLRIATALRDQHPGLEVVLPHRDPKRVAMIQSQLENTAADTSFLRVVQDDPAIWLRVCRAALVKSGTGSLESTLCGAPTVVVYVLDSMTTRWAHRSLLNVPYFAAANLIANRQVAPEFAIKSPEDWNAVEAALDGLLRDGPSRDAALAGAADVAQRLGDAGASARAAAWALPFCKPARSAAAINPDAGVRTGAEAPPSS